MKGLVRIKAITVPQHSFYECLYTDIETAQEVHILAAFLMESGVKLILPALQEAVDKGVSVRVLTGRYLGITEPAALYLLKKEFAEAPNFQLRLFPDTAVSFHPKAYFLDMPEGRKVYVGSSNLSWSALCKGYEWNYCLAEAEAAEEYAHFRQTFEQLFAQSDAATDEIVARYAAIWKPARFNRSEAPKAVEEDTDSMPAPKGVQVDILYYLQAARKEGVTRGLVVAATGIGKTYLAAFDSIQSPRVLFLAHRKEILEKAQETFLKVRPQAKCGLLVNGKQELDSDLLFASVQSLNNDQYLQTGVLAEDRFDYIVVDEFHHAAAPSYERVLNYFKPQRFLLGLTATPFRGDNRDILKYCGDTVIFELYLKEAVQRGLLAPFRYYAFYDETNYDEVRVQNGQYVMADLERALCRRERGLFVVDTYRRYQGSCALGFCASIAHVEKMVNVFREAGVDAAGLVSSPPAGSDAFLDREQAIKDLESGAIRILFTVDMFNEGVDIPRVDQVLFLRPTESPVIFLQQLGRGLRLYEGKEFVTVLDFIGNYRRAHWAPALLAGENPRQIFRGDKSAPLPGELEYPEGCFVQFDFRLIELFEEMRKHDPLQQRMDSEYQRLCRELERRPGRMDVYRGSDIAFSHFLREGGWLRYLQLKEALTDEEQSWLDTPVEAFLANLEKTTMVASYKMPVLQAFVADGTWSAEVGAEELERSWEHFYTEERLRLEKKSTWGKLRTLIKNQPIKALCNSGKDFFRFNSKEYRLFLAEPLRSYLTDALMQHVQDIIDWRTTAYFARYLRGGQGSGGKDDREEENGDEPTK